MKLYRKNLEIEFILKELAKILDHPAFFIDVLYVHEEPTDDNNVEVCYR